jgi:lipase chaperone LimK
MKRTFLIAGSVLILMAFGSVPYRLLTATTFPSLQDKEIDQERVEVNLSTPKNYFDFSLSKLGEASLDQIRNTVQSQAKKTESIQIDEKMFEKYLQYKGALEELPPSSTINLDYMISLDNQIKGLQLQFFTNDEIELLFGEENLLRQFAINKIQISQQELSHDERLSLLNTLISNMPEHIQQAEKNNQLITHLEKLSDLEGQNLHLRRKELVGSEGAARLADLDDQRQHFQSVLTDYFVERNEILSSQQFSNQDREAAIDYLRSQRFQKKDIRRVLALERIHDQNQ